MQPCDKRIPFSAMHIFAFYPQDVFKRALQNDETLSVASACLPRLFENWPLPTAPEPSSAFRQMIIDFVTSYSLAGEQVFVSSLSCVYSLVCDAMENRGRLSGISDLLLSLYVFEKLFGAYNLIDLTTRKTPPPYMAAATLIAPSIFSEDTIQEYVDGLAKPQLRDLLDSLRISPGYSPATERCFAALCKRSRADSGSNRSSKLEMDAMTEWLRCVTPPRLRSIPCLPTRDMLTEAAVATVFGTKHSLTSAWLGYLRCMAMTNSKVLEKPVRAYIAAESFQFGPPVEPLRIRDVRWQHLLRILRLSTSPRKRTSSGDTSPKRASTRIEDAADVIKSVEPYACVSP